MALVVVEFFGVESSQSSQLIDINVGLMGPLACS
jgi:hypothetical protein